MVVKNVIQRYPILTYFVIVLAISYGSFLIVVGPRLLRGGAEQASDAEYILFPVLVISVCLTGLILTAVLNNKKISGITQRILPHHVALHWYLLALFIPPAAELLVLFFFRTFVSKIFTPNFFILGITFGIVPGFLEEIGWLGFAYPKLNDKYSPFAAAIILGVLWGLWHAPVVDFLGAAAPHKSYFLPFFLSFILIVTAVRVLIIWIYTNTGSILLGQLMHISMTASLVILDPLVSPAQETLWYFVYAAVLWIIVGILFLRYGKSLSLRKSLGESKIIPM